MTERIVLQYLASVLDIPVYAEIPEGATDQDTYVVIDKTGAQMENRVKSDVVVAYSYAPSKFEAAELNELVRNALLDIVLLDTVSAIRFNSEGNATDDAMRNYRYQCVVVITPF